MKNLIQIVFAFILAGQNLWGQSNNRVVSEDPGGFSFYLTLGTHPFQLKPAQIDFRYYNGPTYFESTNKLNETNHSVGAKLGFRAGGATGFFFKMDADVYVGQVNGVTGDLGLGYCIGRGKFHVRPQVVFSYGKHEIYLGRIEQDLWANLFGYGIRIQDDEYYYDDVTINLISNHILASPQIELGYQITPKFEILLSGGYNWGAKGKPFLKFEGTDEYGDPLETKESIDSPNVRIFYNDNRLTKSPVGMKGFFMHAGLGLSLWN